MPVAPYLPSYVAGSAGSEAARVFQLRRRATIAEVNAGFNLLDPIPGYAYRIIDFTLIAIGGNAATATSVDINATRAAAAVILAVVAISALTRSTLVRPTTANVTLLADGASNTPVDAGTAISSKTVGSALATATHVDYIITYAIEKA